MRPARPLLFPPTPPEMQDCTLQDVHIRLTARQRRAHTRGRPARRWDKSRDVRTSRISSEKSCEMLLKYVSLRIALFSCMWCQMDTLMDPACRHSNSLHTYFFLFLFFVLFNTISISVIGAVEPHPTNEQIPRRHPHQLYIPHPPPLSTRSVQLAPAESAGGLHTARCYISAIRYRIRRFVFVCGSFSGANRRIRRGS